ncbi:hypothetical protein CEXT_762831 [Caerostris extrusa]|uniref:Uncharacterized protein n=1 Tax=Caerostris extrusa TaxID=172846 RepID=A0AAV4NR04_CAEEX|nr:hypothetical protein CEXT_762831 [Caerostris extrusa]
MRGLHGVSLMPMMLAAWIKVETKAILTIHQHIITQLPHQPEPQRQPQLRAADPERAGRRQGRIHVPGEHGAHEEPGRVPRRARTVQLDAISSTVGVISSSVPMTGKFTTALVLKVHLIYLSIKGGFFGGGGGRVNKFMDSYQLEQLTRLEEVVSALYQWG